MAAGFLSSAYAADIPATPKAGSATTQQQSASHPAMESDGNKATGVTSTEKPPTHPAVTGNAAPTAVAPSAAHTAPGGADVRDWSAIDSNHDQSISPEEMQTFLDKDKKKPG